MSTSKFENVSRGDRVRVVVEGVAAGGADGDGDLRIEDQPGFLYNGQAIKSVEILDREYEVNGIYQDADGDVFKRIAPLGDAVWVDFDGDKYGEVYVTLPVRKIGVDGEAADNA